MNYEKPEITVIGDASHVILGAIPKVRNLEPGGTTHRDPLDCEFDD